MKSYIVIVVLLGAFSLQAQTEPPPQPAQNAQPANQNPPPLDPKNMDTSIKPQNDFYLYANGGWLKRNPVPPEYSRWGSFTELEEKILKRSTKSPRKLQILTPMQTPLRKCKK